MTPKQGYCRTLMLAPLLALAAPPVVLAADSDTGGLLTSHSSDADSTNQKDAAHDILINGMVRYGRMNHGIGLVMMSITNSGRQNHLLSGVSSPVCGSLVARNTDLEMPEHTDDLFTHLALPHGLTMVFSAGGYHLLCREIRQDIAVGAHVPFTFSFLGGSSKTVDFPMVAADDDRPPPTPQSPASTASNPSP